MKYLYEKSKLAFTLVWIATYVIAFSFADKISATIGIKKIVTAPLGIVFVLVMVAFLMKNKLTEEYGFCAFKGSYKSFLFFIPLIPILSMNLWNRIVPNGSAFEIVLHIIAMFCVGFIEEMIFRGFLFKTMCEDNVRVAVLVSSLTFGLGHIVNLLNGADFFPTLLQLGYAAALGLMLVMMFYKGKSLFPCILTHGIFNSLNIFHVQGTRTKSMVTSVILCILSLGYAIWIWKKSESVVKEETIRIID